MNLKIINKMVHAINSRLIFTLFLLFNCIFKAVSQDFYIDDNASVKYLNYSISPDWKNLNIDESYNFLSQAGFSNLKTVLRGNNEIVSGKISGPGFEFMRLLYFENKVVKSYTDGINFIQPCYVCMYSGFNKAMFPDMIKRGQFLDDEMKNALYKHHQASLIKDGITSPLMGDITDFGFTYLNSTENEEVIINRKAELKLDTDQIYNFSSVRFVELKEVTYSVGNFDLSSINVYDLDIMVDVFLADCKDNGILVTKGKVVVSFEPLPGELLGLSYGINNDSKIELKIDPEKWEKASAPKKWYLLYHELGHDVLNLNHGSGGKMMFNFADRGYSWTEFWADREYMFEAYKRMKK